VEFVRDKAFGAVFTLVLMFATVAQGGYFVTGLSVLLAFFLAAGALQKNGLRLDVVGLVLCGVVVIMAMSLFFAFSTGYAVVDLLKYALLPTSYIYFASQNKDKQNKADAAFFAAFGLVAVFGLLAVLGISPIGGMLHPYGRLQSFIQYANTTALLMGIGVFYAVDRFKNIKKYWLLGVAALFFAALLLTQSRVTFALFIAVFLLYVFQFAKLWVKVAAAGGLAAVWGVLALLGVRIARIAIFEPTLVERYISYWDALRLMAQNPLGVGLANWQFLQLPHQSAPYQVRFVHNYYLQLALDGGFLAMFVVVALMIWVFVKGKRGIHFYIGLFILATAFFEVHFAFGLVVAYFGFVLAKVTDTKEIAMPLKLRPARVLLALPIIPLAIMLVASHYENLGRSLENTDRSAAYQAFATSYVINPLNDNLRFHMGRTADTFEEALQHLYAAHHNNSLHTDTLLILTQIYIAAGQTEAAHAHATHLLEIFPLSRRNQDLLRSVTPADGLPALDAWIADIDANINPLFVHIDPYFQY